MNWVCSFCLIHSFSVLTFQSSEDSLPVCSPNSVCNKIDTYGSPWVERQCRCPSENYQCSSSLHSRDGHTIVDRNRQYKVSVLPEKQNGNVRQFTVILIIFLNFSDVRACQEIEAVQVFPWHHLDPSDISRGQLYPTVGPLPVSKELWGLLDQETRVSDLRGHRIPVFFRLLPTNGERLECFSSARSNMETVWRIHMGFFECQAVKLCAGK